MTIVYAKSEGGRSSRIAMIRSKLSVTSLIIVKLDSKSLSIWSSCMAVCR